jgi:carbonic anhydrase
MQLDLQQLLPSNTTYMAYGGSLTTPPCSEGVTWLVLLNTQPLSLKQVRCCDARGAAAGSGRSSR